MISINALKPILLVSSNKKEYVKTSRVIHLDLVQLDISKHCSYFFEYFVYLFAHKEIDISRSNNFSI
jgi:general stress protein CsbA